jgi:glyoxylase-like metal-dependent hydrolase (beta-lactamase superfamily II)
VDLREIDPGLWYWTAPHPDWGGAIDWPEEVGCVCVQAPAAATLIDPLLPRGEEPAFWDFVDGFELPVAVLLTAPWHQRDAQAVAERYGTTVWAHEAAAPRLPFSTRDDALPDGVEAFVPDGVDEGQVAFYLPEHQALVVAELFMGTGDGLRVCPSPAMHDEKAFYRSLQGLLDLPIERVLVAHGEPVLSDGRRRIAEALAR